MAWPGRLRAMRSTLLTFALVAVLAAACGSAGGSSTSNPSSAAASSAASQAAPSTAAGGGSGKINCSSLKDATAQLLIGAQVLAQLRTPETIQALKDGTVGPDFDPDKFIAAMQQLHVLDSVSSPLGDQKTAIDAYIAAAQGAKALLAKSSVTQADIDAYVKSIGSITDFLSKQAAISGALSTAGC